MRKNKVIKYALITLASLALYCLASQLAYIERGYFAFGGELAILMLPFLWSTGEAILRGKVKEEI